VSGQPAAEQRNDDRPLRSAVIINANRVDGADELRTAITDQLTEAGILRRRLEPQRLGPARIDELSGDGRPQLVRALDAVGVDDDGRPQRPVVVPLLGGGDAAHTSRRR